MLRARLPACGVQSFGTSAGLNGVSAATHFTAIPHSTPLNMPAAVKLNAADKSCRFVKRRIIDSSAKLIATTKVKRYLRGEAMTAKSISVWWLAGALVVGGVLCISQEPSWAADPVATQPLPVNGLAPTLAPAPNSAAHGKAPAATPMVTPAPAAPMNLPPPASQPSMEPVPSPPGNLPAETGCGEGEGCGDLCGGCLCSPPGKYWLRADYLTWWTNGTRLPPLVTTSPDGTLSEQAGVLGAPGTTAFFGGTTVGDDMRSGFRTVLGMWLDSCREWSVQFDYLSLGQRENSFEMFSTGSPILARPYFNVQTNLQASELVAYPGEVEGTVAADARTYFQGAGVTFSRNLCCGNQCAPCGTEQSINSIARRAQVLTGCTGEEAGTCDDGCGVPLLNCCRTDMLIGFRYYNLSDFVGVREDLRVTATGQTHGDTFVIHDNFRARNDFYGTEIGLRTQMYRGRWSFELLTKLALGNNHQTITINGQTAHTPSGGSTAVYDAGILAGSTNSGVYQRDQFTIVPQLGIEIGYQLSCHWRTYVGYDLLYWGSVARAADQIDLNLDPRNFPPATPGALPFPQFPGKTDAFWAQGLHLGLERRF